MVTILSRSSSPLWSDHAAFTIERHGNLSHRPSPNTTSVCTSHIAFPPDSFHRFLELPQELLDQVYRAYCEPYYISFGYPPSRTTRHSCRQLRPLRRLKVRGPPSANFSMTNSRIYSELEELRRDAFDGEVRIQYDETEGFNAIRELCNNDRYSWVRDRVTRLVVLGAKGLNFDGPENLLEIWNDIAKPGNLPQLRAINITYEAKRSKFVVKDADFELPTEEWFKVSAQEYIDHFHQGEEDIEYEYPGGLLRLRDLKQLLTQNGNAECDVFLTTRVTWKQLRDDQSPPTQNGHESIQSVTFRVVSDDLEGIERLYQ